jgi:predicted house-cleaning NTP pyrophosphatase (Maf/HAM1 superfamily)
MKPLSTAAIDAYLATGLWRGKAGACGYQDEAIPLELRAGSGSNVVGLPLETLREIFRRV